MTDRGALNGAQASPTKMAAADVDRSVESAMETVLKHFLQKKNKQLLPSVFCLNSSQFA